MNLIDLTQPMTPGMPVFPETPPPIFGQSATIERDGFEEGTIFITTHTGTHLDAPAHLIAGGITLDAMAPSMFWGPAVVLDVTSSAAGPIREEEFEGLGGRLAGADFALIRTGWSVRWGNRDYFEGHRWLSREAALLLSGFPLKGIGIDAPSLDAPGSADLPAHRLVLERGMVILENMTRLERLPAARFLLVCFPLALAGADGSPARVIAVTD